MVRIEIKDSDYEFAADVLSDAGIHCEYGQGCIYVYSEDQFTAERILLSAGIMCWMW